MRKPKQIAIPVYVELLDGKFIRTADAIGNQPMQRQILGSRLTEEERRNLRLYFKEQGAVAA